MTSGASSDDPEGSEHGERTPDKPERQRPLLINLQGISMPKVDFKIPSIMESSAFVKVAASAANLSSFSLLPKSTLNRLAGLSEIAAQQSKLIDSLKPFLDAQNGWRTQLDQINSDLFKSHTATQTQFANLGANLTKTFDFGVSDSMSMLAKQFAAQQASWLETLGPTLERLRKSFYPPNLRGIEDLVFEDVEKVVMADGIALYGVPRSSIAEALIRAESDAKRREILGRRWNAISADCRNAVESLRSEAVAAYASFAVAALNALDNSHTEAAQALTGSLIDSLLTSYFGKDRTNYTPDRKGKRTHRRLRRVHSPPVHRVRPHVAGLSAVPCDGRRPDTEHFQPQCYCPHGQRQTVQSAQRSSSSTLRNKPPLLFR